MSNVRLFRNVQARCYSVKTDIKLDNTVDTLLNDNLLKHRNHPGIVQSSFVTIPTWIKETVKIVLEDTNVPKSNLYEGGQKLKQHLHGRHIVDETEKSSKRLQLNNAHTKCITNQSIHYSSFIKYTTNLGLYYLAGRSFYDYSVLYNVLNEIKIKDTSFKPATLFDFGSGVGTVMWAASGIWSDSLKEYFAVDSSSAMHDLSEKVAERNIHPIKNIFHRQFLPALSEPTYDIVVSSFTLMDLPDMKTRFDVIQKLWKKTTNYLVIIEEGTNSGFSVVNEARDIILFNGNLKSDSNNKLAHVFAPCPHDMDCPRYATDNTPCNFEISYHTLPLKTVSRLEQERYCYVILKKGGRPNDDKQWPRIVRPTLKRSKHVICRTCTASGNLEEFVLTSYKYGKNAYRCAKACKWGDLLPIDIIKDKEVKDS